VIKKLEGPFFIRLAVKYLRSKDIRVIWPKPKKRVKKVVENASD